MRWRASSRPSSRPRLGQPVVVDNRGGAGGAIGGELVAKSPADGYTVMLDASNHAQNPALRSKMPFDTLRDLAPVSLLVKVPNVLVVNPATPITSVKDLIAQAKAKPGRSTTPPRATAPRSTWRPSCSVRWLGCA